MSCLACCAQASDESGRVRGRETIAADEQKEGILAGSSDDEVDGVHIANTDPMKTAGSQSADPLETGLLAKVEDLTTTVQNLVNQQDKMSKTLDGAV